MKKVLSLMLILLLLLVGCTPRPAQSEFVPFTDAPATAEPTEAPIDDSLVLLPDVPQAKTAAPAETLAPTPTAAPSDTPRPTRTPKPTAAATECPVRYGEDYDDRDRVALYLHLYGELPPHFITKQEAQKLGWSSGEVENFRTGAAIGGDFFGNYQGLLPKKKGRRYFECDIGTVGKRKRGEARIIFSNDGLVYYTDDHYNTFTLLYGEE